MYGPQSSETLGLLPQPPAMEASVKLDLGVSLWVCLKDEADMGGRWVQFLGDKDTWGGT